jgi:peptidoglycan biosynthesis protein MviN/MurJ (putative lipid II flippase)
MIPRYGVMGAAIASSVPRIAVFPIYNYYVYKKIGVHWPIGDSIRVVLASVITGAAAYGIQRFFSGLPGLVVGILLGVLIYFLALLVFGFVTSQEIILLRKVEKRFPSAIRGKYSSIVSMVETFTSKNSV